MLLRRLSKDLAFPTDIAANSRQMSMFLHLQF
jgi:hypothetical protein